MNRINKLYLNLVNFFTIKYELAVEIIMVYVLMHILSPKKLLIFKKDCLIINSCGSSHLNITLLFTFSMVIIFT